MAHIPKTGPKSFKITHFLTPFKCWNFKPNLKSFRANRVGRNILKLWTDCISQFITLAHQKLGAIKFVYIDTESERNVLTNATFFEYKPFVYGPEDVCNALNS